MATEKRRAGDVRQLLLEVAHGAALHFAREAERDVEILRRHPARIGHARLQRYQVVGDFLRDGQGDERRGMGRRGIVVQVLGHERQDALDDHVDALGVGMDAVGLVERRILRHAVEEEGIERHAVLVGQPLVEPVELLGVLRPVVARRQHAGQPHRDAGRLELGDDGVEVALGRRRDRCRAARRWRPARPSRCRACRPASSRCAPARPPWCRPTRRD